MKNQCSFVATYSSQAQFRRNKQFAMIGLITVPFLAFSALADITGTVFRDNSTPTPDGIQNGGETGPGSAVAVTAIDSAGVTISTTSDPVTGAYTLTTGAGDYRIEFSSLPAGFTPSPSIGGATTQYVSNEGTANFAVLSLTDACDANPFTFTPCYVTGDPAVASVGDQDAIVGFRFNDSGDSTANKLILADIDEVGSTWGAAYDPLRQRAYFSAVVRRHVSLGPGGVGQIYSVDLSDFSVFLNPGVSAVSNLVNISGTNPVGAVLPGVSIDLTNAARDIAGDASADLSADLNGFQAVGRVGLGDIDISADFNTLYAINLGAKSLISVDLTNNTVGAGLDIYDNSPVSVTSVCAKSEFRPWAIKIDGDDVYVGAVCSGETAGTLRAFILQLNPAGTAFTETFAYDLPLSGRQTAWTRTDASFGNFDATDRAAALAATQWKSWVGTLASDWPATTVVAPFPAPDPQDDYVIHAQPMLSDIEIDPSDGSFILGYNDRQAMIGGFQQDQPSVANNTSGIRSFVTIGAGDIIRVENTGGSLSVAAGEYYTGELWNNGSFDEHQETALGSLAVKPDASEVMVTVFDPLDGPDNLFNSGGTRRLSNASGAFVESFRIYDRTSAGTTFAKAAGLGDLEIACNTPIVVGDFVFNDLDQDGQQDVDEPGIPGVIIQIFDSSGTQVGGDITTGPDGEWVSPELQSGSDYCAVFPASNFAVAGALNNFQATIPNASGVADNIDSELTTISGQTGGLATFNGQVGICFNSGTITSFDFDAGVVDVSNLPGVGNLVWVENASSQNGVYNFGVDSPADGVLVQLYAAGATPGVDSPVGSDVTDTAGCYEIRAAEGDYFVHIPAASFASGDLAGTVSITGNGGDDQSDDNISGLADNGIDAIDSSLSGISSVVFNLAVGAEDATEGGKAGGTDSPDLNLDYTIDFGFEVNPPIITEVCVTNSTGGDVPANSNAVGNVGTPLQRIINVPDSCIIQDVTLGFIGSTDIGNINGGRSRNPVSVTLTSPSGTVVNLKITGGGGQEMNVIFDDAAAGSTGINAESSNHALSPPYLLPRVPSSPLSAFDGENGQGDWTITVGQGNGSFFGFRFIQAELCIDCGTQPEKVGVGNLVFIDNDNSGGFTPGDTQVKDVTVELMDGSSVDATAVTNDGGCYSFVTDPGSNYSIRIPASNFMAGGALENVTGSIVDTGTPPVDSVNGAAQRDDSGGGLSDENGLDPASNTLAGLQTAGITSGVFGLNVGTEPSSFTENEFGKNGVSDDTNDANVDLTIDFGFTATAPQTVGLGNIVFMDNNGNGVYDGTPTDMPIPGVLVEVYPMGTDPLAATATEFDTTDANGEWSVSGLSPGTYFAYIPPSNFASGSGALDGKVSVPGNGGDTGTTVTNEDADENGIDDLDPVTNGIRSEDIELTSGGEPTGEGGESGQGTVDNPTEDDSNFDGTVDFGFINEKANSYTGYLTVNAVALGLDDNTTDADGAGGNPPVATPGVPAVDPISGTANTGVTDVSSDDMAALTDATDGNANANLSDPDGDGFSNLLEYALCYDPGSGLKTFPDGSTDNDGFRIVPSAMPGQLDICYTGPTGAADLAYTLQQSTDGQMWTNVTSITPTTATGAVDGTTKTTFGNVTSLSADGPLLFRLKVDALDVNNGNAIVASDAPQVLGYLNHCIRPICETFSDPFLMPCEFTGTVTSVSGQDLVLTGSLAVGSNMSAELTGANYYVEVVSGDNAGQRFDITSVGTDRVTLANDSDLCALTAPHSTITGAASANLMEDQIVIRQHRTIADVYPVTAYEAGGTLMDSARILLFDASAQSFVTYQLDSTPSIRWEDTSGNSVMDNIVPPGQGAFTHNVGGPDLGAIDESCVLQYGEVRETAVNVPLCDNYNFISSLYPIAQTANGMEEADPIGAPGVFTPTTDSRQMNQDNTTATYNGSPARSRADQVQLWNDDTNTDGIPTVWYKAYFYAVTTGIDQWTINEDPTVVDQNAGIVFDPDRSAIICVSDESDRATNIIPTPIDASIAP